MATSTATPTVLWSCQCSTRSGCLLCSPVLFEQSYQFCGQSMLLLFRRIREVWSIRYVKLNNALYVCPGSKTSHVLSTVTQSSVVIPNLFFNSNQSTLHSSPASYKSLTTWSHYTTYSVWHISLLISNTCSNLFQYISRYVQHFLSFLSTYHLSLTATIILSIRNLWSTSNHFLLFLAPICKLKVTKE